MEKKGTLPEIKPHATRKCVISFVLLFTKIRKMNARFLRLPQHVWFWTVNSDYCCDVINGAAHPVTHAHLLPKQIPLLQFEKLIVD